MSPSKENDEEKLFRGILRFNAKVLGLILGLLETLGAAYISSAYKDVIAFVVLLLVLFIRPRGLLGGEGS